MHNTIVTRRESIISVGAVAAGLLTCGVLPRTAGAAVPNPARKRALRVAHLTDIHVQPERRAGEGMAACLHHVERQVDKPDLIVTGGDSIMDSFAADDARTNLQWDLWNNVLKNECSIPVRSCIGNHDVWGWAKSKSKTTGAEPNWGKKRAIEMLRIEDRFYSFSQAGWLFIVLDSTQPHPDGSEAYVAVLDEPQYDWLERTLRDASADTPVFIVSHIPILSTTPILWAANEHGNFRVKGWLMHSDHLRLKELFARHPNVKLCLSGHTHLVDRVDYNGVSYLCNGAVSGNWWNGRHKDCDEGYALVDLFDDGSFDHQYVKYGWKAG
jgi:3',5'-cyclic AMP phosphodiesterase CpdA